MRDFGKTKIGLLYNGFLGGGGYAAERQCDIAWGFNPKSVLIFILRPEGHTRQAKVITI